MKNGARQRQSLPHALRVLRNPAFQFGIKPNAGDGLDQWFITHDPVEPREVTQVLKPREFVIKQRRVGHIAHVLIGFLFLMPKI